MYLCGWILTEMRWGHLGRKPSEGFSGIKKQPTETKWAQWLLTHSGSRPAWVINGRINKWKIFHPLPSLSLAAIPESNKDNSPAWKGGLCPCSTSASALLPAAPPLTLAPLPLWLSVLSTVVDGFHQKGQQTPSGCHYPARRQVWKGREKGDWVAPVNKLYKTYCKSDPQCLTIIQWLASLKNYTVKQNRLLNRFMCPYRDTAHE